MSVSPSLFSFPPSLPLFLLLYLLCLCVSLCLSLPLLFSSSSCLYVCVNKSTSLCSLSLSLSNIIIVVVRDGSIDLFSSYTHTYTFTGKSLWQLFLEQFDDLLVKILLAAATISFVSLAWCSLLSPFHILPLCINFVYLHLLHTFPSLSSKK